jgi:hypothetical protein
MDLHVYSVECNEAMKRGNEALNASSLHRYNFFGALNASSPLLFIEKHRFALHCHYFFIEIHCLTLHRRYFLK